MWQCEWTPPPKCSVLVTSIWTMPSSLLTGAAISLPSRSGVREHSVSHMSWQTHCVTRNSDVTSLCHKEIMSLHFVTRNSDVSSLYYKEQWCHFTPSQGTVMSLHFVTRNTDVTSLYHKEQWCHFTLLQGTVMSLLCHKEQWCHFILPQGAIMSFHFVTSNNDVTSFCHKEQWCQFTLSCGTVWNSTFGDLFLESYVSILKGSLLSDCPGSLVDHCLHKFIYTCLASTQRLFCCHRNV